MKLPIYVLLGLMQSGEPAPIPNGARVRKIKSRPEDSHRDGEMGTVLSACGPLKEDIKTPTDTIPKGAFGYFVVWDDMREVPVFVAETRIEKV